MFLLGEMVVFEGHPLPLPEWMRLLYGLVRLLAMAAVVGLTLWLLMRKRQS